MLLHPFPHGVPGRGDLQGLLRELLRDHGVRPFKDECGPRCARGGPAPGTSKDVAAEEDDDFVPGVAGHLMEQIPAILIMFDTMKD